MGLAFDIVVLGDYFFDLIYTGLPEFPKLGREIVSEDVTTTGGAMYITAVSLQRLGVRVGWPAHFGNDYYSQTIYDLALREHLDLSLARHVDAPYRRVTTSLPYHGERAFVTFTDPEPEDLYEFWLNSIERCQFNHLHFGGLSCLHRAKPLLELARARGATVSTDCQDGPHLEEPCQSREILADVDIFMPNAREALIIAETDTIERALDRLMEKVSFVVVKDGAHGAWVGHAGSIVQVDSVHIGDVVDTTGAGDCFNAGFLYGHMVEHVPLEVCAVYGNICGGFSVTGVGGATTAPTRAQLMDWAGRIAVG